MNNDSERRRVLLATGQQGPYQDLFRRAPLDQWVKLEADSFSRARFVMQHEPCDVLLVNDDLYDREGGQGLAWLACQQKVPVALLVGANAETYTRAYELDVSVCLPRDLALSHPTMLAAGLDQAVSIGEMRFGYQKIKDQLNQSRRHTDCLVNLLWRTTPRSSDNDWFPQRYMLERLCEEIARTERHGTPLTMVLGELHEDSGGEMVLPDWATKLIVSSKRRCDVAGQYGTNGFLMLLVHTTKEGGLNCCRRLQQMLEHPPTPQPPHRTLQTYFGIVGHGPDKNTPQSLLRCAEETLETARANETERIAAE